LLANIVGLSGILAFFGVTFGAFESWTPKKRKAGGRHPLTTSLTESSNVPRETPLPTAEPTHTAPNERSLWGIFKRKGPVTSHPPSEPPAAEFTTTLNPLLAPEDASQASSQSSHQTFEPTQWQRFTDDADVWFVELGTGRTEWKIPEGGEEVI